MSNKCLTDEEKKMYEMEFTEFLKEKIKCAGGSLQFHLLCTVLPHARFEIRDAFGTTKNELMKFLKTHPEIFQIDTVGIVTIAGSDVSTEDLCNIEENSTKEIEQPVLNKIEKGTGLILKIHSNFGIIQAIEPIETRIHFKPSAYNAKKDSLFIDCNLEIGSEVYFDAVYGHDDFEIKFHATKVWSIYNENPYNNKKNESNKKPVANNLEGEGNIQTISCNWGYISVFGEENETVYFFKNSIEDHVNDLTQYFNVGDRVEFSAIRRDKDSKAQWKAEIVRKKSKKVCNQSPKTNIKTNICDVSSPKIENEQGKFFPRSHGAIIKFGKDYSQLADGNSSEYFLYGDRVSDIIWEFSEGDDVLFDAVKTNVGWKAIRVWVGKKPTCLNYKKTFPAEEINEFCGDKNYASSDVSSTSSNLSVRSKTPKSQSCASTEEMKKRNKLVENSVCKEVIKSDGEYEKQNSKSTKNSQSVSAKRSKNKKLKKEQKKEYSHKGKDYKMAEKWKKIYEPEKKNLPINKNKSTKYKSVRELDDTSSVAEENDPLNQSFNDNLPDISQDNFKNNLVSLDQLRKTKHLKVENKYNQSFLSASKFECTSSSDDNIDNESNETTYHKINGKLKPSIKKFEDIDGEIKELYCKVAMIGSSHLQREVDFVLNAFYINGKSVEDQVIDLKEIIKVGDSVKFNCFEIIDDSGEIHQKVTMAWIGPKPKVYEMTPEEFINEYDLSVTLNKEVDSEYVGKCKINSGNFLSIVSNSEETLEIISNTKSLLDDISDDEFSTISKRSTEVSDELEEENVLSNIHNKLLIEMIMNRLKSKGLVSSDSEVDLKGVVTDIIDLVLKHCNVNACKSQTVSEAVEQTFRNTSQSVCATCGEKGQSLKENVKQIAVQTIITGSIIAQSIYAEK